jgi:hypothetical protein
MDRFIVFAFSQTAHHTRNLCLVSDMIICIANENVRFQVLTTATMKMAVFWIVTSCSLMMEAASTSETSVNFYQTTRRYNREDSHLHTRRRENLKSHNFTLNLIYKDIL